MPESQNLSQFITALISAAISLLLLLATPSGIVPTVPPLVSGSGSTAAVPTSAVNCQLQPETPLPGSTPTDYPANAAVANQRDPQASAEAARIPEAASIFTAALTANPTNRKAQSATPKSVVLQAGHWQVAELPDELAFFRDNYGGYAAGQQEWQINLAIANRAAAILQQRGYSTTVIGATVPPACQADAFVALHADMGDGAGMRGYKAARAVNAAPTGLSLLRALYIEYGATTALPRQPLITYNMSDYYAFNTTRFQHSISPTTPAVVLEMGYMSNARDRSILYNTPDVAALGVANGIDRFLQGQ